MKESVDFPSNVTSFENQAEELPTYNLHSFKIESRNMQEFIHIKILPDIRILDKNDCKTNLDTLLADFYDLSIADAHFIRKKAIISYIIKKYFWTNC